MAEVKREARLSFAHLNAPNAVAVVEGRVDLPHVPQIPQVPRVHAVVAVHARQVLSHRVKGQGQGVRVLSVGVGGEQMPVQIIRNKKGYWQHSSQYLCRGLCVCVWVGVFYCLIGS